MKRFGKIVGWVMVVFLGMSFLGTVNVQAAEQTTVFTKDIMMAYTQNSRNKGIIISSNTATIEGSIHSNKKIYLQGRDININGNLSASDSIMQCVRNLNLTDSIENDVIYYKMIQDNAIEETYLANGAFYQDKCTFLRRRDIKITEVVHASYVNLVGMCTAKLEQPIAAKQNISLSGGELTGTPQIIYSEEGNIYICGDNINLTGLIYAPKGHVVISGRNVTINGYILADDITVNARTFTVLPSQSVDDFMLGNGNGYVSVPE